MSSQIKLLINWLYIYNYLYFCSIKSFIFLTIKLYYYITIIISHKQYFKRITALAANSKRVVKYT